MLLNFYVKYGTKHGEQIFLRYKEQHDANKFFNLNFVDGNLWHGSMQIDETLFKNGFAYDLIITGNERQNGQEVLAQSSISFNKKHAKTFNVVHENFPLKRFIHLNATKPFKKVFKAINHSKALVDSPKKVTHIFTIESPFLQANKFVCLTGNANAMNNFDDTNPLLFKKEETQTTFIELDLSEESFPLEFKLGIFDTNKNKIVEYEPGVNHLISNVEKSDTVTIINLNHSFTNHAWKGAGINVPVFSLRTNSGWGTGEFADLNLLVDYAANVGLKLIQLLPINDTTGAYTDKDSYPYSAITSFGLHPKFLNVQKMADAVKVFVTKEEQTEIEKLNLLSYSDHNAVVALKIAVLKRVFEKEKNTFTKSEAWTTFFEAHNNWLIPFAAFCVLRDKFATPDFSLWQDFSTCDKTKINLFSSKDSADYEAILFWYFVQFNLHVQLEDAIAYAQQKGVVLKADLPIGVGRLSADTWENPTLFVMEMQAGAPPDAFSGGGQNWSFPTYNIAEMAKDGFAWFRRRMQHLQTYFDAVRIDHVLGIFRIWSIPLNQVEGTMGKFVPAISMNKDEFYNAGLNFDEYRFCQPFITEEILYEKFGNDTGKVKDIFFSNGRLADEFNDQRKVEAYFAKNAENIKWQQGLFDLIANVILFKEESGGGYHFRINMFQISSYTWLSAHEKSLLDKLYHKYFFEMQNDLWRKEGEMKLEMMTDSSDMLLCAEDLGMVPDFTDEVLKNLDILSLQVQQMPKDSASSYSDTAKAKYESIVMPATHDMSPMRLWWEENRKTTQSFFNNILDELGTAPQYCEPWVCRKIVEKHLQSPAMWSIFLMQDVLALNGKIRLENPNDERINIPSNPNHVWNYRMHISLENLIKENELNDDLKNMIKQNNR
jgi:4-alpha-glucanotransferase